MRVFNNINPAGSQYPEVIDKGSDNVIRQVRSIVDDDVKGTALSCDCIECFFCVYITYKDANALVVIDKIAAPWIDVATNYFFCV